MTIIDPTGISVIILMERTTSGWLVASSVEWLVVISATGSTDNATGSDGWTLPHSIPAMQGGVPQSLALSRQPANVSLAPDALTSILPMNLHFVGCACAPISSTLAINLRPLPSPPPSGEGAVWLGALTPKWCASAPYGKVHRAQFGRGICDRGLSRKRERKQT